MPIEITMPQLSDTMTEGTVVQWKKAEGDTVSSGEEVADVETDKATMPMESFDDGVLAAILIKEGEKVQVGQALAVLAAKGEDAAEIKKQYASDGAAKSSGAKKKAKPEDAEADEEADDEAEEKPSAKSGKKRSTSPARSDLDPGEEGSTAPAETEEEEASDRRSEPSEEETDEPAKQSQEKRKPSTAAAEPAGDQPRPKRDGERIIASPLAKRMAADLGVNLAGIEGSGPNGRIVQKDVEEAAAAKKAKPAAAAEKAKQPAAAPLPPRVATGEKQVVPLSKMRATIAQRLQASTQNLPHFYETIDIDCENVMALRKRLNEQLEKQNIRLSLADFIAKALAVALMEHPNVNATFDGKEVTQHGDVNLGMAVALPNGLIVPVLRGVNQMGLKEIRQRTSDLIDRARQQKLKGEEMSGGTFTISNLGNFGIREFTAIINPPEVAILAIGAAERRPVCKGDQIVARTMMTVTMSSDHRVVDGAAAAEFLRTFKSLMEEPGMMLV